MGCEGMDIPLRVYDHVQCMHTVHVGRNTPLIISPCPHFRQGSSYIQFTASRHYSTGCVLQILRSLLHPLTPQAPLVSSLTGSYMYLCIYVLYCVHVLV